MSNSNENLILSDLRELCYRAHSGTSFSPEKRADYYVREYSKMLEEDLKELGDNTGNYKEKFIAKFSDWMNAKSRCISSMITGPAKFPTRRAMKYNDYERSAYDKFAKWREKYFKAVNRIPWSSPEEELEIAENRLERLSMFQMEMKEVNATVRKLEKKEISRPDIIRQLLADGFDKDVVGLVREDYGGKFKIPAWQLTNNNATIKRTEEKVKIMQSRIERKESWSDIEFDGGYLTIDDDRVKIFHDEKPEREIIQEIKSNGFRWSPNWKCWCRKHTAQAIRIAKNLSFIKEPQTV